MIWLVQEIREPNLDDQVIGHLVIPLSYLDRLCNVFDICLL